jgi:hypothetical protein
VKHVIIKIDVPSGIIMKGSSTEKIDTKEDVKDM